MRVVPNRIAVEIDGAHIFRRDVFKLGNIRNPDDDVLLRVGFRRPVNMPNVGLRGCRALAVYKESLHAVGVEFGFEIFAVRIPAGNLFAAADKSLAASVDCDSAKTRIERKRFLQKIRSRKFDVFLSRRNRFVENLPQRFFVRKAKRQNGHKRKKARYFSNVPLRFHSPIKYSRLCSCNKIRLFPMRVIIV